MVLTLDNITVSLEEQIILKNLSCQAEQSDVVIIVGANGVGKSSFFDVITGALRPDSGVLSFDMIEVTHLSQVDRSKRIGRLFQDPNISTVSSMSVAHNCALALYKGRRVTLNQGMSLSSSVLIAMIKNEIGIDISAIIDKRMGTLSNGQKQLVAFIMAMLVPCDLLLLDEPTASLDPIGATTLLRCVNRLVKSRGITTLIITHDAQVARFMGNKLWIFENNTIQRTFGKEKLDLDINALVGSILYDDLC